MIIEIEGTNQSTRNTIFEVENLMMTDSLTVKLTKPAFYGIPDLEKSAILKMDSSYITELDAMLAPVKSNSSRWRLCWRGKSDGWLASTFHSNCDNKGATVTVIQVGVYVFGGYVDVSWNGKLLI